MGDADKINSSAFDHMRSTEENCECRSPPIQQPRVIASVLADAQVLWSAFAASTQTSTIFLRLIGYIRGDFSPIRETWLLSLKLLHSGFLKFEVSHKCMFSTDSISFFSANER